MNLYHGGVGDTFAGKYSGGLKRRLSVAVSLIGDPKVTFNLVTISFLLVPYGIWMFVFYLFCVSQSNGTEHLCTINIVESEK
ncbi:hypothetical protein RND81_01G137500 [Saponaria officinalis]|uniref:Uncharacterized protein n=1 Tax=Saponaria officinalis TaxID=3572 RepID=A0AAW1NFJ8_SAPOF